MGVMNCDRRGCDSAMCDKLSHKFGYICNECMKELIEFCLKANSVSDDIVGRFMETPKKSQGLGLSKEIIEELLDGEFLPQRWY